MAREPKQPELEPQHWRYIQLRLEGYTNADAAASLGIDRGTAWRWGQMQLVKDELDTLQRDATETCLRHLKELRRKATRRLNELLESENEAVALGAVREVLSRLPEMPPDVPELSEVPSTGNPWDGE